MILELFIVYLVRSCIVAIGSNRLDCMVLARLKTWLLYLSETKEVLQFPEARFAPLYKRPLDGDAPINVDVLPVHALHFVLEWLVLIQDRPVKILASESIPGLTTSCMVEGCVVMIQLGILKMLTLMIETVMVCVDVLMIRFVPVLIKTSTRLCIGRFRLCCSAGKFEWSFQPCLVEPECCCGVPVSIYGKNSVVGAPMRVWKDCSYFNCILDTWRDRLRWRLRHVPRHWVAYQHWFGCWFTRNIRARENSWWDSWCPLFVTSCQSLMVVTPYKPKSYQASIVTNETTKVCGSR